MEFRDNHPFFLHDDPSIASKDCGKGRKCKFTILSLDVIKTLLSRDP